MRMPRILPLTFAVALLAAPCTVPVATAQAHEHDHAEAPAAVVDPAQRFAADATLHRHMESIAADVDGLSHFVMGHLGPEQAVQLADRIAASVRSIIAECRLPPDADQALHGIIAPLLQNAGKLSADPTDTTVVAPMQAAVAEYQRLFEAPEPVVPATTE